MSKMSTEPHALDLPRHALNGPTMGTRWSALFFTRPAFDPGPVQAALQAAVEAVDAQMSTWKPESDLMRLNRAPVGIWLTVPPDLARVLALGRAIGRASGGAFDMGMGDAVRAWGFGPQAADPAAIRAAITAPRRPAHQVLEIDGHRVRKTAPVALDLNGIAKGYGVDRLAEGLRDHGIANALVGIDGEMRALGLRPDCQPWTIAVETPDPDRRAPHAMLALQEATVATSGDYRHWVKVQGRRLSHTMDPTRGTPLMASPAALMVLGAREGARMAARIGLDALILLRDGANGMQSHAVGRLFAEDARG